MNRIKNSLATLLVFGLLIAGFAAQATAQISRANQRQVSDVLRRVNVKVDDLRYSLDSEFSQASTNRSDEDQIKDNLSSLQAELNEFQDKFNRRRESADDAIQVLDAARTVDDSLRIRRFSSKAQADWTSAKTLFDQFAGYYGVSTNWNNRRGQNSGGNRFPSGNNYPNSGNRSNRGNFGVGLTGTYELDTARSENTRDIAERAINDIDTQRRDESRRDLEDKLEAPTLLAIEVRGNQITLASTRAASITFTADGRDRTETLPDGRTVRLRTTLRGQELTVSSIGGDNDYTVTFASIENGNSLRVTRRITTEYLRQTIFAESIYNKTDATARLDVYGNQNSTTATNYPSNNPNNYPSGNYPPSPRSGRNGQFIVPNGTILSGVLEHDITTAVSQNNDPFRLTVTAPNQYRGAIIEGYISGINRSGKVSGRSQLTLNFETIRLTNGNTYDFAGYLQSVTDSEGKTVQVDTEGSARGDNQTKETIKRGGIGAGIGAIIGAIAGGGKGAAIGAIIGGGAGAGSVYIQGKDDLELKAGSTIMVQASSPAR